MSKAKIRGRIGGNSDLSPRPPFTVIFSFREAPMPIHTIAQYCVKPSGIDKVKRAIAEFVPYVRANEPGTKLYQAWQQKDDPTRFVHFFIFEDETAHAAHAGSEAVKRFEAAYRPELSEGDVIFTDYQLVAANRG
jgi:quinol monooxygenase YgiN